MEQNELNMRYVLAHAKKMKILLMRQNANYWKKQAMAAENGFCTEQQHLIPLQ